MCNAIFARFVVIHILYVHMQLWKWSSHLLPFPFFVAFASFLAAVSANMGQWIFSVLYNRYLIAQIRDLELEVKCSAELSQSYIKS